MSKKAFSIGAALRAFLVLMSVATVWLFSNTSVLSADRIHILDAEVPTIGTGYAIVSS